MSTRLEVFHIMKAWLGSRESWKTVMWIPGVCAILTIAVCVIMLSLRQNTANGMASEEHNGCTLIVSGTKLPSSRYVSINADKKYALLPMIPLCEACGANVSWTAADTAEIRINGQVFCLNTTTVTLTPENTRQNWLLIPPGTRHGNVTAFVDDVFTIDNDSLMYFFYQVVGARIEIDYQNSVVTIVYYDDIGGG